jgi:hypothetical protein
VGSEWLPYLGVTIIEPYPIGPDLQVEEMRFILKHLKKKKNSRRGRRLEWLFHLRVTIIASYLMDPGLQAKEVRFILKHFPFQNSTQDLHFHEPFGDTHQ